MEKKNIDWSSIGFAYMPTDYRYVSNFKDGKCTMCGALDPDFVPEDQKKPDDKTDSSKSDQKDKGTAIAPKTGDNSNIVMWVALMLVSGMGIASVMLRSRKGQSK